MEDNSETTHIFYFFNVQNIIKFDFLIILKIYCMNFGLYVLIVVFYLSMAPFGALIATLTFPIKRKSVSWFFGTIWPLTILICFVIGFFSFITEEINTIIKSR